MPFIFVDKRKINEREFFEKFSEFFLIASRELGIGTKIGKNGEIELIPKQVLIDEMRASIERGLRFIVSTDSHGNFKGLISFSKSEKNPERAMVFHFFVRPEFRGKGEGTKLIFRLIAVAKRKGFKEIDMGVQLKDAFKLCSKLSRNQRLRLERSDLVRIKRALSEWRSIPSTKRPKSRMPEIMEQPIIWKTLISMNQKKPPKRKIR